MPTEDLVHGAMNKLGEETRLAFKDDGLYGAIARRRLRVRAYVMTKCVILLFKTMLISYDSYDNYMAL